MSSSSHCGDLALRLAACADEGLSRLAREEAAHLEACGSCRAALARREPTALFALLTLEKKDDAFFTGFETRVLAGVREARREERGGWLGAILRPRFLALAAGAAAIAVALMVRMEPPRRRLRARRAQAPAPRVAKPSAPPVVAGRDGALVADLVPILERDAAAPSPVESVASATARVISIEVAGPQQEPPISC
jgi:hypothetical protein